MTLLENLRANRLILGIANVGFWVVCSAIILVGRANLESTIASISPVWIWLIALTGYTLAQGIFDWIGSTNSHNKRETNPSVAIQWIRGVALQTVVWASISALIVLASHLGAGYCFACLSGILLLCTSQLIFLKWINGGTFTTTTENTDFAGKTFFINCPEATFTGGTVVGIKNEQIVPLGWRENEALKIESLRRNYAVEKGLPVRTLLILIAWNLVGVAIGDWLKVFDSGNMALTVIYFSAWMTLWSFIGLLILPSLSHSSVYAADRASYQKKPKKTEDFINKFPDIVGENGHNNPRIQKIFYPIPNSKARLEKLNETSCSKLVLGSLSRTNLFLSWACLNLTARSVHCNFGRPLLWIYPPAA